MKFATITSIAIVALAQSATALRTVTLKTFGYPPPQYPEVTGKSVSAWHEGAGINYLLIAEPATKFTYDEESKHLYFEGGQGPNGPLKWYFTIGDGEPGILQANPTDHPTEITIDNLGFITFEGSYNVKGAKNIDDPYNYSKDHYVLAKYDKEAPSDAVQVFFQAIDA